MVVVVLGLPGSGKGTLSKRLSEVAGVPHLSTGDMFRDMVKNKSGDYELIKEFIDKGELVPDKVNFEVVKNKLSEPQYKNGVILDGFPRTTDQIRHLDVILEGIGQEVDIILETELDKSIIVGRTVTRFSCPECGEPYTLLDGKQSEVDGICDKDGVVLTQREDDKDIMTIVKRIKLHESLIAPVKERYLEVGYDIHKIDTMNTFDIDFKGLWDELTSK